MCSLKLWAFALLCAGLLASSSEGAAATGHTYKTGKLAGHKVEDLYADYIGVSGTLPAQVTIDWNKRLAYLWYAKAHQNKLTADVVQLGTRLQQEYRTKDPGRMSLATYTKIGDRQAAFVRQSTDWNAVARIYRLNPEQLRATRAASTDIGGQTLISYSLAELMPGRSNGTFNRDYFDFLLRNAGRRFVESIPATHDSKVSYGTFQFTDQALYDVNGVRRGASKFNEAIRGSARIPGSTMNLRGDDHFRAAYLFAMNNTAETVKRMNKKQLATFERVHTRKRSEFAQFIAVSHNKPAHGRSGALRWLSDKARHPFIVSVKSASRIYAAKTSSNYRALKP